MDFEIIEAEHIADYRIKMKFADGSIGTADLASYVNDSNVFKAFRDITYFKQFHVECGTVVWGKGELDIAPETLYEKATGKKVRYLVQNQSTS